MLSASMPALATTYTWTGGNGSSNSWYYAGNWAGNTTPLDDNLADYVFAASGWNATQTTIVIGGADSCPEAETLTFNGNPTVTGNTSVPLTIQIGSGNSLYLSPSSSGGTTIAVAQTGATQTIAGSSGAYVQLGGNQQWSVDGTLNVSAVLWGDTESLAPNLIKTGAGTLILSGNNSFTGPITIDQGVLSVSTIANKGKACNLGAGDLTLSGGVLSYTGTAANVSTDRGFALAGSGGTIDVHNATTSLTFTGAVTGSQAGLTKTGSGTLILSGANSYTGLTTVQQGALEIANPTAVTNLLTAGANVTGGELMIDATGAAADTTVRLDLKNSVIYDSTKGTDIALGYFDNGTKIIIEPTYLGDATGNGYVDISDLSALGLNWHQHAGTSTWAQGDFNYDGNVDISDLSALGLSWHATQLPTPLELQLDGGTITAVPEPSSVIMLATFVGLVGAWWGIGRRPAGQ